MPIKTECACYAPNDPMPFPLVRVRFVAKMLLRPVRLLVSKGATADSPTRRSGITVRL